MKRIVQRLFGLLLVALPTLAQAVEEPAFEKKFAVTDIKVDRFRDYGGTIWWKSRPIKNDDAQFIRLKFTKLSNPAKENVFLVVRDGDGRELQRFALLEHAASPSIVTMRLSAPEVTANIEAKARPKSVRITLAEYYLPMKRDGIPLSVESGNDAWNPVAKLTGPPLLLQQTRGVVNLLFTADMRSCSGFLIAPDRIMTNDHCLALSRSFRRDGKSCADVEIQLDYLADQKMLVLPCHDAVTNRTLDIAVLRVVGSRHLDQLKNRHVFRFADTATPVPTDATVVHHPAGLPMMVSRNCKALVLQAKDGRIQHNCNTVGGSSGGVMMDAAGKVIGVQVEGYPPMTKAEYDYWRAKGKVFYNYAVGSAVIQKQFTEFKP